MRDQRLDWRDKKENHKKRNRNLNWTITNFLVTHKNKLKLFSIRVL